VSIPPRTEDFVVSLTPFNMIKITNNDLSALSTDKIQALDFNATWCVPCKALKPKLEAIEKDFVNIEFADVDVDENEELCKKFNIRNVPCLVLIDGEKQERIVGAINKQSILSAIEQLNK